MSDKQYLVKVYEGVDDFLNGLHSWSCIATNITSEVGGWVINKVDGTIVMFPNNTVLTMVEVEDDE